MDAPTSLRVVGPQGQSHFKASIGKLDIYDNPYCCRGMTLSGYRCSRNIAASHVPKLPAFSLKGIVAYYKPKNSYGNCLAAYYCWQHTSQASFTKRSSTIVHEEDAYVRQPLAEKTRNVMIKTEKGVMTGKIKVEEVEEVETAQSNCRASTRNTRPAQIKVSTPKILEVETMSPAIISPARKMFVFKGTDSENVKPAPQTEKTETTSTTVRRKTTEMAELKAVNTTLQAAVQQLTSNEETKSTEMKELKTANAALLAAVQVLTGQVEGLKVQMVRMEEERMEQVDLGVAKPVDESTGKDAGGGAQAASEGYYQPREKMGVDKAKEPLISVKPFDLETGLQDSPGPRPGLWQRVKTAFCLCG